MRDILVGTITAILAGIVLLIIEYRTGWFARLTHRPSLRPTIDRFIDRGSELTNRLIQKRSTWFVVICTVSVLSWWSLSLYNSVRSLRLTVTERDKEISSVYATSAFQARNIATLESARITLEKEKVAAQATETEQAISLIALKTTRAAQATKSASTELTQIAQATELAAIETTRVAQAAQLASARATITRLVPDTVIPSPVTIAPTPTETPSPTPTSTPSPTPTPSLGDTRTRPKDEMVMVYVPSGTFQMGSHWGETEALGHEFPQHEVFLDGFWIDQTEVTNSQYMLCVADSICGEPSSRLLNADIYYGNNQYDNYPVIYVTWEQARAYCQWAGAELPSEAQWEYAARGLDGRNYPWGNDPPNDELANYSTDGPTEVRSYPKGRSWCGAFDMAGNVWEWVNDWYDGDYYGKSETRNPTGPTSETMTKVMRGGSWAYDESEIRAANRGHNYPASRFHNLGFRCVASPSASGP